MSRTVTAGRVQHLYIGAKPNVDDGVPGALTLPVVGDDVYVDGRPVFSGTAARLWVDPTTRSVLVANLSRSREVGIVEVLKIDGLEHRRRVTTLQVMADGRRPAIGSICTRRAELWWDGIAGQAAVTVRVEVGDRFFEMEDDVIHLRGKAYNLPRPRKTTVTPAELLPHNNADDAATLTALALFASVNRTIAHEFLVFRTREDLKGAPEVRDAITSDSAGDGKPATIDDAWSEQVLKEAIARHTDRLLRQRHHLEGIAAAAGRRRELAEKAEEDAAKLLAQIPPARRRGTQAQEQRKQRDLVITELRQERRAFDDANRAREFAVECDEWFRDTGHGVLRKVWTLFRREVGREDGRPSSTTVPLHWVTLVDRLRPVTAGRGIARDRQVESLETDLGITQRRPLSPPNQGHDSAELLGVLTGAEPGGLALCGNKLRGLLDLPLLDHDSLLAHEATPAQDPTAQQHTVDDPLVWSRPPVLPSL